ncbi:MAG: hypothetical protein KM296_07485 [Brockia lithotrophica]|nr:hypothetical protein [Brockia lithotrophica]
MKRSGHPPAIPHTYMPLGDRPRGMLSFSTSSADGRRVPHLSAAAGAQPVEFELVVDDEHVGIEAVQRKDVQWAPGSHHAL